MSSKLQSNRHVLSAMLSLSDDVDMLDDEIAVIDRKIEKLHLERARLAAQRHRMAQAVDTLKRGTPSVD